MYMPPEVYTNTKYHGKPFDIWSLGIILYAMVFQVFPFETKDELPIFDYIPYPKSDKISIRLKKLLSRILNYDHHLRPTIGEILLDPWFMNKKYENKLLNKFLHVNSKQPLTSRGARSKIDSLDLYFNKKYASDI